MLSTDLSAMPGIRQSFSSRKQLRCSSINWLHYHVAVCAQAAAHPSAQILPLAVVMMQGTGAHLVGCALPVQPHASGPAAERPWA